MAKTGAITVLLAGTMISGCATITRQCDKPDQTSFTHNGTAISAPEGCRFVGAQTGAVRTLSCENARQGVMVIDLANGSTGT
jgi:hypothetical protein